MKPRLRFIDGLWYCGAWPFAAPYTLGCAYKPELAYADWKRLTIDPHRVPAMKTQSVSGCALSAAQS